MFCLGGELPRLVTQSVLIKDKAASHRRRSKEASSRAHNSELGPRGSRPTVKSQAPEM